ncbi:hypothetical protein ACRAWG_36330 [Methylobacterium sp. P31]
MRNGNAVLLSGLGGVGLAIFIFRERFDFLPAVFGYPLLSLGLALLVASAASQKSLIGGHQVPFAAPIAIISYNTYLTHKIFYYAVHSVAGVGANIGYSKAVILYGWFSLAGGALLYWTVERPFLQIRDFAATSMQDRKTRFSPKSDPAQM